MVTFAPLNLAENVYPSLATNTNAIDLILCRNVILYLQETVIREIAQRLDRCLMPEGWLIISPSEAGSAICEPFDACRFAHTIVYRKTDRTPVLPDHTLIEPGIARPAVYSPPLPAQVLQTQPTQAPRIPGPDTVRTPPATSDTRIDPYRQGLALMERGRYEEAMERFSVHIASDPEFAPAYYQMALALANRGRLKEAKQWCEQAIERNPGSHEAHYTLALVYQEEGNLKEAISHLKKTLYLASNAALAHFSLANIYREAGRQDEARRHRTHAIRLAAKMPSDAPLSGSDGLTAGNLLSMLKATL